MAYQLNGSSQFLSVPVDAAFEFGTGDFTVSLVGQINQSKDNVFVMLGNGAGANPTTQCAWAVRHLSGLLYWYRYAAPTETAYTFSWTPSLNVFYTITISRVSGSIRAYIDGTQIGSAVSSSVSYNRINSDNLRVGIANFGDPVTSIYANIQVSELAIWKAGLTDAEITALARGFTADQVRPQSLSFYAPLVRNLQDVRGGLAITNNNSATVATHPRIIT